MSRLLPDTLGEVISSAAATLTAIGLLWGRRRGGLASLWGGIISAAAAPVERALAQREAKALRIDNIRLAEDNEAKDKEIARLRSLLSPGLLDGSSKSKDGNDPILPS